MGVNVSPETATKYGCIVHDPSSSQVLHYVEKPEKWISNLINGGIYLFDRSFFDEVKIAMETKQKDAAEDPFGEQDDLLRLEQDVIVPLAASKKMFVYESKDFWRQIKTAGSAVPASALYLAQFQKTNSKLLTPPGKAGSGGPMILPPVFIDPTAEVDETAKIGPNVSLGPAVRIAAGARVKDAILMEGAFVDKHACVQNAIVGKDCKIGQWSRIDGEPAAMDGDGKQLDITILATNVTVAKETVIRSCIVLPSKTLTSSAAGRVLL
jgi:mannose-1-phosphate guanylyltransferase